MKKRRVLALFLALSMALSSNGFTALAADQDSVAAIEAGMSEGTDETEGENIASDANDENGNNASESENGAQDNTGENGDTSEGGSDVSEGGNTSDGSGETENGNSSENNDGTGDDNASSDENGNAEDSNKESDGAGENEDDGEYGNDVDASDEADVSDEAESEKDIQIDGESVAAANSTGVRMCTFTDETGMVVTYDLNASEDYIYEVDETDPANPVLTGISEMVNGVKQPVALSGVIKLREPEEDEQFNTIGAGVFKNNTDIEYVILPDNVKNIESGAFLGCTKLRGIKLPSGLEKIQDSTFEGCAKLTQLSIPKGTTSVGSNAFKGDSSLFMVYIKDSTYSSMLTIGDSAFEGCKKLEKFGSDTDFVLPGELTEIGAKAFMDCYAIKKVTLPDTVKEKWVDKINPDTNEPVKDANGETVKEQNGGGLGTGVFMNCIGLTDVTLSGVEDIPKDAFNGCSNLLSVKFANGNKKIGESAFEKCIRLGQVIFSNTIDDLTEAKNAFSGCSNLRYVEIPNSTMKPIPSNESVFPNNNEYILWMRGFEGTEVEKYALAHNNIQFIAYKDNSREYFKYTYQCLTTNAAGTVKFFCEDKETDPNAKNGKKGVWAGTKIYVSVIGSSTVKLTEGSLRCNGTPIGKDKDSEGEFYTFTMPVGGAYVTAEFERTGKDENQNTLGSGDDIKSELSNGNELKVGQTTRMFLIDTSPQAGGSAVATSKIKFSTSNKTIASVSNDGTIKALKEGTAYITAEFRDNSSKSVSIEETIIIDDAEVRRLRLKPFSYDTNIIKPLEKDSSGDSPGVALNKVNVENRETTFTILATAYTEDDDNMSVALKWTTSDSKVAKIGKSSTTSAESQNTVTIPKGASGEAVITATATNADPEKSEHKTISKKFIIRVQDITPRLAASTLTINPYKEKGAILEIIEAYGNPVDEEQVKLMKYEDKDKPSTQFTLVPYNSTEDDDDYNDSVTKFMITARDTELPDGTCKVSVYVKIDDNPYYLPLNIKVKRSIPNPKVKISKKQPKLNLFYKNGGVVQKDGSIEPGEVIPEITNLGDLEEGDITYSLKNLSNSGDNAKFTDNFEIDETTGVITRTTNEVSKNSKNKPIVTGLLRLEFDGYKDGVNYREYKITIPTKTTKPAYKLERSSDTFKYGTETQEVCIALKEGKKKVNLNEYEGEWDIYIDSAGSTTSAVTIDPSDCTNEDGYIKLSVNPKAGAGKAVIAIHNEDWDDNQIIKLNYTAKISSKKTVFKLDKSSVTLNKYFSSNTATVTFKSNQYGVPAENMDFEAPSNLSETKEMEYSKVSFTPGPDSQQVTVGIADDIKKGTYRFTCKPLDDEGNKVTLTVKVIGVSPTVSLKGSAKLNRNAGDADTAELTMNFKNKPANIDLNWDDTTIEYVTNREDEDDVIDNFFFDLDGNKLKISLKEADISAKTYTFKMTPAYVGIAVDEDNAKSTKFKVKVYSKEISVSLKAKGRLNLLDRYDDTYFDNMDVPATESLSIPEEDSYAAVVDSEAVPSFDEGEGGSGEGEDDVTEPPVTPEPDDPPQGTPYTITLSKPGNGVETLGYCVIDSEDELDGSEEYIAVDSSKDVEQITSSKIIAVKITLSERYKIDGLTTSEVGEEGHTAPDIKRFDGDSSDESYEIYLIKKVAADENINIKVSLEDGNPVQFVLNNIGGATKVKKPSSDNGETYDDISNDEKTTDQGYTFVVERAEGKKYSVSAAVYDTSEYEDGSNLTDATLIDELTGEEITGKNALKYTISADAIEEVSDEGITIVLTESYTVTITNDTDGKATDLQYKIVTGSNGTGSYSTYEDEEIELGLDEKLSLQFKMLGMEESDLIVVKTTDSKGNDTTIRELEFTGDADALYAVENIDIAEDTIITFSVGTKKKVTLDLDEDSEFAEKVEEIKYAVFDNQPQESDLANANFDSANKITFSGEKYLALKFTLSDGYTVKLSIQKTADNVALAAAENTDDSDFEKVTVDDLGDIYLSKEKITDDMIISIQVEEEPVENTNKVNFEKVGPATGGAKIMKADGTEILTGGASKGTDSFEKDALSYQFVINTDNVNVEASYEDEEGTTHKIEVEEPSKDGNEYTYTIDTSQIDGDITIVVTDTYEIIIKKNPADVVEAYYYSIGSGENYDTHDTDTTLKVKVPYDGSLSIKIPYAADRTVLLIEELDNGDKTIHDAANSTTTENVYTISNVTAEKELTISQAYKVTGEIKSTDNRADTATVEYFNVIKNSSGSEMFVLAGSTLGFTVTPREGYKPTVEYKLFGDTEARPLEADNNAEAETDGYYTYSIGGNADNKITDDIDITITTEPENADKYIVKFNVEGATVQLEGETENIPETWKKEIPVTDLSDADRTIKFKVNVESDKHLRYVGTDKALKAESSEITGPDSNGYYTFTLPNNPYPVTTIYISATATKAVNIAFTVPTNSESQPMAGIYKVTKDANFADNNKITTTPIISGSINEMGDSEFCFIVRAKDGYTLSSVTVDGKSVTGVEYDVYVDDAADTSKVYIYELALLDKDVTVALKLSASGSVDPDPDEPEVPKYPYDPKSCIIYTPVVSNLKDTVDDARIYDASERVPNFEEVSKEFDIHVVDGLLYVMPKREVELDNNKVYPVKIWIHFSKYDSGIEEDGGGIWVKNTIKIKTAQILPKVTASTNTINLYQSNTGYKATFILRTKENSIGKFRREDEADETTKAIVFGEKDEKARNSLDVKTEVRGDGSLKVTVMLKDGALYAANSTNKVKMYVKFENQAENTLGTAITMNVKVNK